MVNDYQRRQLELLAFELGQDPRHAKDKQVLEKKMASLKPAQPPERVSSGNVGGSG
jgi:hypothetical protein